LAQAIEKQQGKIMEWIIDGYWRQVLKYSNGSETDLKKTTDRVPKNLNNVSSLN
jgi:hypothetical protein